MNKPADQTGVRDGMDASKAVDGLYGTPGDDAHANINQSNCARPHNKNIVNGASAPAEWWVDLQDTYRVDNVTIYNTYARVGMYVHVLYSLLN